MAGTRQSKSGSATPRKKAAPKPNGAPPEKYPVGAIVELTKSDIETLAAMRQVRDDHQQHLGLEREAYLAQELQRLTALRKAMDEYQSLVLAVSRKLKLPMDGGEAWRYEPKQNAFIRTG